jgi:uncharacterized protein YjbI with pentapeptide repeats/predicted amidohydrolase
VDAKLTRVAVVQLECPVAAVLSRRPLLEDPSCRTGNGAMVATADDPEWLGEVVAELRSEVRAAHLAYARTKVAAITRACRALGVELLVFPEYSIPAELLVELAGWAGDMTVVAGTHAVERATMSVYEQLGLEDALPEPGMAIAPVLHRGRLVVWQAKLSESRVEQKSLKLGTTWRPVDIPELGKLGVLVCLDFLYRQRPIHHEQVGPQLSDTTLLAVPSFTPWHSVQEFDAKSVEASRRYGQPVLYANVAGEGGTTVHADVDRSQGSSFPEVPATLGRGEEGVVVVDLDLNRYAAGRSTRYEQRPVARGVAAASLIYRHTELFERYAEVAARWAAETEGDEWSLEEQLAKVADHEALLREVCKQQPPGARQHRLTRLLDELGHISSREDLRAFIREIPLPSNVLPWREYCLALSEACRERLFAAAVTHRASLPAWCESLGVVVATEWASKQGWAETALIRLQSVKEGIADERARVARFPADAPLPAFRRMVAGLDLVFCSEPNELLSLGPRPAKGMIFLAPMPGDGNKIRTAEWPVEDIRAIHGLWLAARAQGRRDVSIIGVLGESTVSVLTYGYDEEHRPVLPPPEPSLGTNGGLFISFTSEGRRRLLSPKWALGGDWLEAHAAEIRAALSTLCADLAEIEFVTRQHHLDEVRGFLPRFVGARERVIRVLERKLAEVQQLFVEPLIQHGDQPRPALAVLGSWLASTKPVGLLFGRFGSGKSTLLSAWAKELWERSESDDVRHSLPIFVDLAGVTGTAPDRLLVAACGRDPTDDDDVHAMRLLVEYGLMFPIFDGIDELATGMTEQDLARAVFGLATVAGAGKALLSLRDHAFRDEERRQEIVHAALAEARTGAAQMTLEPFGPQQVEELLERMLPKAEVAELRKRMSEVYDLEDLARTPLLLTMIVATREQLAGVSSVSSAMLYSAYIDRWLAQAEAGAPELLTPDQKIDFAEALALEIWSSDRPSCSWDKLQKSALDLQARATGTAHRAMADGVFAELQGASFFVREHDDHFRFAHKSFLEYFMARAIIRSLPDDPERCLATRPLRPEVSKFVFELAATRKQEARAHDPIRRLSGWLRQAGPGTADRRAVANALRLLRDFARLSGQSADWIPQGIQLPRLDLRGEDLRNLDLAGASFEGANLQRAKLDRSVVDGCCFRDADLRHASLHAVCARGTSFEGAVLRGAVASDAVLSRANMARADLRRSTWTSCDWTEAGLAGAITGPTLAPGLEGLDISTRPALLTASLGRPIALAWSPAGTRLAVAGTDGKVGIWDVDTFELEVTIRVAGGSDRLAWSPDGKVLVCANREAIWFIDPDTGGQLNPGVGARPLQLAWSPCGRWLAQRAYPGRALVVDVGTMTVHELLATELVDDLEWLPERGALALALRSRIEMFTPGDWSSTGRLDVPTDGSTRVCRSAEPGELIIVTEKNILRRVEIESGEVVAEFALRNNILSVTSSPDASSYFLRLEGGYEVRDGHDDRVLESGEGHVLQSPCASNKGVWARIEWDRVWVGTSPSAGLAYAGGELPEIVRCHWSNDGRFICTLGRWLYAWSTTSLAGPKVIRDEDDLPSLGESLPTLLRMSGPRQGEVVAASPTGDRCAFGTNAGVVYLRNGDTGTITLRDEPHRGRVLALAWSPDGERLASSGADGVVVVRVADEANWHVPIRWESSPACVDVRWSPDGSLLVLACGRSLSLRNPETGERVTEVDAPETIRGLAWSPDQQWVACWGDEGVHLWNVASGEIGTVLHHPLERVCDLAWSPRADRIACAHADVSVSIVSVDPALPTVYLHAPTPEFALIATSSGEYWTTDETKCRLIVEHPDQRVQWYLPMPERPAGGLDRDALLAALRGELREFAMGRRGELWDGRSGARGC